MRHFSSLSRLFLAGIIAFSSTAKAARFENQFVGFELPAQWQCSLESSEWVCQSTQEAKKKEAIIVIAAKLKGDQDTLEQYLDYLKRPKTFKGADGKLISSEVRYTKKTEINQQEWADSLQSDSELAGYVTRYLATTKLDIGVLVTYSILAGKYEEHLPEFEALVKTLQVFRKAGGINTSPNGSLFDISVPQNISDSAVFPPSSLEAPTEEGSKNKATSPEEDGTLVLIGVVAAAAAYLIWRRRSRS